MILKIRSAIPYEEFDYLSLMNCLKGYKYPRDKVSSLLAQKKIIRVKKGLYTFGDELRRGEISREILGNLIYGPSYISLDYALSYHGLIPERVDALTSVTSGRSRKFNTPMGLFIYRRVPFAGYPIGIQQVELNDGRQFLIATAEKALADKLRVDRSIAIRTMSDIESHLIENLRIEADSLKSMDALSLRNIAQLYGSNKVKLLSKLIEKLKE